MPMEIIARLGRARKTLETLMARKEPRCRWPRHTPSGTATASATPIEANEMARWASVLSRISPGCWPKNVNESSSVRMLMPAGRDELGLETGLDPVEDRLAQAAGADVGGDRGQADRRHRRDPQPGHDRGQGQRKLDPYQRLATGEP